MTREEAIEFGNMWLQINDDSKNSHTYAFFQMALKALEQEPCCNCIEFKRYAKQMGFEIEKQSIPYLMHKEMDIPISECQKAYDVAIDYLRSQGKVKG